MVLPAGYHHGTANPFVAGRLTEGTPPPLQKLNTALISHFDKIGKTKSKMKMVISEVDYFARLEGVWQENCWTKSAVTTMWSTIWHHLEPYLRTITTRENDDMTGKRAATVSYPDEPAV